LNILRQQYQIAKIVPSGIVGGLKESQALQKGLIDEINRIKGLIEEQRAKDTPESLREVRRLQQIMLGMEAELRTLRMQEMQYLIDSFISQAMQSMNFEKIVIDENRNLAMALEKGLIAARPYITGRVGEDAWTHEQHPVTTQQYINQQRQATGGGVSLRGIVSPIHAAVSSANDLVEVAKARLEVLKAERQLSAKEIALLEDLLDMEPEGVDASRMAGMTGGSFLNTG
jgi:hypothetical protein